MSKEAACPHCHEKNCIQHCASNKDGLHVPKPETARYGSHTKELVIVDVNCMLCGQSGGVTVPLVQVVWD